MSDPASTMSSGLSEMRAELARLTAENARLREALERIAQACFFDLESTPLEQLQEMARAALEAADDR